MQSVTNNNARVAMAICALAAAFGIGLPVSEATPILTKEPTVYGTTTPEVTPILYQGQQLLFQSHRGWEAWDPATSHLLLTDLTTGQELSRFGNGYSFGCAYVEGSQINVYATNLSTFDVHRFSSTDKGQSWTGPTMAVPRSGSENLYNSSVCQDPRGYLMAYESNKPVQFCFKFARSTDLATWTKLDVPAFAGPNGNEYSACPVIRYCDPYYYVTYLHKAIPEHNGYISYMARSKDLSTWQYSSKNPVLEAGVGNSWNEGINNSDVDLIEIDGKTYVYYLTGDQYSWGDTRRAVYDGPMPEFFESYFEAPEPSCCVLLGGAALLGLARHRYLRRVWRETAGKKVVKRIYRRRLKLK